MLSVVCPDNHGVCLCMTSQEQETLSFVKESLEKSDQLTKGMVVNIQMSSV